MIGLDAVDISRFKCWPNYSIKSLQKVFHIDEINYAFANPAKTVERLAARFAAKEAFYKALSAATNKKYSLLYVLKNVRVTLNENGAPFLIANQDALNVRDYVYNLTITHTEKTAIALVMFTVNRDV